uniref:Uncharacterized protein n=1 Tax=Romanomermis culicivorax TaxID=13658 RepID=A0A915KYM0_ROMCU
ISEIIEQQTEQYLKQDPDPFDERHPGRVDPNCTLGHVMKVLLKDEDFIAKLLDSYLLARENVELNIAACRLLLDIIPATDVVRVFQETEGLIEELFRWADTGADPLKYYACGLLSCAMEVQDMSSSYRASNSALFPALLRHLHTLKDEMEAQFFVVGASGICKNSQQPLPSSSKDDIFLTSTPSTSTAAIPPSDFSSLTNEQFTDDSKRPALLDVVASSSTIITQTTSSNVVVPACNLISCMLTIIITDIPHNL